MKSKIANLLLLSLVMFLLAPGVFAQTNRLCKTTTLKSGGALPSEWGDTFDVTVCADITTNQKSSEVEISRLDPEIGVGKGYGLPIPRAQKTAHFLCKLFVRDGSFVNSFTKKTVARASNSERGSNVLEIVGAGRGAYTGSLKVIDTVLCEN